MEDRLYRTSPLEFPEKISAKDEKRKLALFSEIAAERLLKILDEHKPRGEIIWSIELAAHSFLGNNHLHFNYGNKTSGVETAASRKCKASF